MCERVLSRSPRWIWIVFIAGGSLGIGYWVFEGIHSVLGLL